MEIHTLAFKYFQPEFKCFKVSRESYSCTALGRLNKEDLSKKAIFK